MVIFVTHRSNKSRMIWKEHWFALYHLRWHINPFFFVEIICSIIYLSAKDFEATVALTKNKKLMLPSTGESIVSIIAQKRSL